MRRGGTGNFSFLGRKVFLKPIDVLCVIKPLIKILQYIQYVVDFFGINFPDQNQNNEKRKK